MLDMYLSSGGQILIAQEVQKNWRCHKPSRITEDVDVKMVIRRRDSVIQEVLTTVGSPQLRMVLGVQVGKQRQLSKSREVKKSLTGERFREENVKERSSREELSKEKRRENQGRGQRQSGNGGSR